MTKSGHFNLENWTFLNPFVLGLHKSFLFALTETVEWNCRALYNILCSINTLSITVQDEKNKRFIVFV